MCFCDDSRCFPLLFKSNPSCVKTLEANIIVFFDSIHCFLDKKMSGLSVEMLGNIVAQLANQGLPLTQGNSPNNAALSVASSSSTAYEDEVLVGKQEEFTMEQLLSKRKKNEKATQAQQTFSYVLREAAKITGLWDSAPLFREIAPKVMEKFILKVTNALPRLNCHNGKKIVRERFSEMMTYHRNHLKNTKYWKRSEKLKKYGMVRETRVLIEDEEPPAVSTADVVQQKLGKKGSCEFQQGDEVLVIHNDKKVARAGFLRKSSKEETYAKLKMTANYSQLDVQEKIKLGGPNEEKFLQDIENNRKFYWPLSALKKKGPFARARGQSGRKRSSTLTMPSTPASPPPPPVIPVTPLTPENTRTDTFEPELITLTPPPSQPSPQALHVTTTPAADPHPRLTTPLQKKRKAKKTVKKTPLTPENTGTDTSEPELITLTPPPSQPSTPQALHVTTTPAADPHPRLTTPLQKKRKTKKTVRWYYEPVTDANKESQKELPTKRRRTAKTVYDA